MVIYWERRGATTRALHLRERLRAVQLQAETEAARPAPGAASFGTPEDPGTVQPGSGSPSCPPQVSVPPGSCSPPTPAPQNTMIRD